MSKECKWHRVCPGLYHIGNVTVNQLWHIDGSFMWHVIVNDQTVIKWAYLRDAKVTALKIHKKALKGD